MIDVKEIRNGYKTVEGLTLVMCSVARQEDTCVALALDETVNGITVGLDTSNNDSSLAGIVGECSWFLNTSCTS